MKKFFVAATFLILIAFAIPIEHKYDKLFRFFSLTLIPDGLTVPKDYDQKIYFYISDLAAVVLLGIALFWFRIPWRKFFLERGSGFLWVIFFCALGSIIASPFAHYPIPYIRLWQLLTPILLFSFLAHAFTDEQREKITRWLLLTLVIAALFQAAVAIAQYFLQDPIGLRILGEQGGNFSLIPGKHRWIFDSFFGYEAKRPHILRAIGTFPHTNVLGGFLALSILAAYFLIEKVQKGWAASIPFLFFALCTTFSRSALFAWALGTIVWFFFQRKQASRLLSLTLIFSVAISAFLLSDQFLKRGGVVNYNAVAKGSDSTRLVHQNIAFRMIEKNPFLGVGFTQLSIHSPEYFPPNMDAHIANTGPHNIYLFLATETGLISLAALLLFIATLLFSVRPTDTKTATLFSIFLAFLFIGGCDFYPILFHQGKMMFFLIAGLLAAHIPKKETVPIQSDSWKMFDLISPTYDRINRVLSLGMDQNWRKKLASHLPLRNDLKILDLATGTGDQLLALFEKNRSIQSAIGIDLATEMLQIAKKKLESYPHAVFLRADAQELPFPDSSFDAATFSFGIRNVANPLRSLKEIERILKPNGRCLILEFSLPARPLRFFYLLYLRHLLPHIGGFLSRKPTAYRYLNQTIETFPSGKEFCSLMEKAKLAHISAHRMAFGAVTLYVGDKM
ncbi:MAG TPA: bifunctional demethylmenaquinone methyltransferase/2-methoxy-6-polyprenyl-1,4-benzoquinol methylase UbiE [Chlamydiales bacterium]|nr:bifunctional demethylmenaquinone methyltransferase/2-methoxy-6-polyprenyl-1,4-benzoquinol methylase UbiE [Chlamydiales bacterium]